MFRDGNQFDPLESGKLCYDYINSCSVKEMCPNLIKLRNKV